MANILIQCLAKKDAAPAMAICMAKGFAEDKDNMVYCILSDEISNKNDWLADDRLKITFIDTGNKKNFVFKTLKMLLVTTRQLKKQLKNKEFILSIQPFVHPWGALINKSINAKHCMGVCHDPNPHSGESLLNRFFAFVGYSSTNELIVLTRKYADIVRQRFGKPVYIMKLGIFSNYSSEKRNSIESENRINFLFFGRIEKYKGIAVLLNSYKILCEKYEDISLTIAGSGDFSEYNQLVENCNNLSILNRYIRDEEVGNLFEKRNTVLVLPYLDATQSGVVPIAIDFEVPIIASDSGGLREQLDDGKIGLFVKPGSVSSLTEKMKQVIENPNVLNEQIALEVAFKRELSWGSITKKLLDDIGSREHK